MNITMTRAPAPTIPEEIEQELLEMDPRVFMVWNSTHQDYELHGQERWEGRWEIWCELRHSTHPDARNELAETDRWNTEHQCWMRRLQTYETAEGEFAPADRALVRGLKMADAWASRTFYEDKVAKPHQEQEEVRMQARREIFEGASEYYRTHDNLRVGRYANSGWRWRTR